MVSHHPAKFACHRHCSSGDVIFLICHDISPDQLSQELCNLIDRSPSGSVTTLPSFVAIDIVIVEMK